MPAQPRFFTSRAGGGPTIAAQRQPWTLGRAPPVPRPRASLHGSDNGAPAVRRRGLARRALHNRRRSGVRNSSNPLDGTSGSPFGDCGRRPMLILDALSSHLHDCHLGLHSRGRQSLAKGFGRVRADQTSGLARWRLDRQKAPMRKPASANAPPALEQPPPSATASAAVPPSVPPVAHAGGGAAKVNESTAAPCTSLTTIAAVPSLPTVRERRERAMAQQHWDHLHHHVRQAAVAARPRREVAIRPLVDGQEAGLSRLLRRLQIRVQPHRRRPRT